MGAFMKHHGITWGLPLFIGLLVIIEGADAACSLHIWYHNRKVKKMDKEQFEKLAAQVGKANQKKEHQPKPEKIYALEVKEELDEDGNTILVAEDPENQTWEWEVKNK